ncbi:hypothetical protein IW262DRAFT_1300286 [Armillaria fumosa]|nr:hypothetical protein IW262DRAFT_1300286 [Armillaria fumosa]
MAGTTMPATLLTNIVSDSELQIYFPYYFLPPNAISNPDEETFEEELVESARLARPHITLSFINNSYREIRNKTCFEGRVADIHVEKEVRHWDNPGTQCLDVPLAVILFLPLPSGIRDLLAGSTFKSISCLSPSADGIHHDFDGGPSSQTRFAGSSSPKERPNKHVYLRWIQKMLIPFRREEAKQRLDRKSVRRTKPRDGP